MPSERHTKNYIILDINDNVFVQMNGDAFGYSDETSV